KYSAKDSDYLQTQKVFEVFYKALKAKRFVVVSGLLREAMTTFNNGKLAACKARDVTKYVYPIMYTLGAQKYVETEKRLLTYDEMEEINGQFIAEKNID